MYLFIFTFKNVPYILIKSNEIESILDLLCLQPRESKLRTEDKAQAHESSSEFEIAALFQIILEWQFQIQSYFYELEHYLPS